MLPLPGLPFPTASGAQQTREQHGLRVNPCPAHPSTSTCTQDSPGNHPVHGSRILGPSSDKCTSLDLFAGSQTEKSVSLKIV